MIGDRDTRAADRDGEPREAIAATRSLFTEVVGLFHRLRILAEQLHRPDEMTAGSRSILFELDRSGPRTVPQMARARPVARQHIQGLVDSLRGRGLVELVENPAHRRSHLVRLTGPGRVLVEQMNRREIELLERLEIPLSADDLQTAAEVLRTLRESLARPDVQDLIPAKPSETTLTETVQR